MSCGVDRWMSFNRTRAVTRPAPGRLSAPVLSLLAALVLLSACASPPTHRTTAAEGYPLGYTQRGIASWYGPGFHGNQTANGERYNMHKFTAAHRTLPMGALVEVRSLTSGKRIKVRINDRGPFVRGRIIDLSYKAAKALGMAVKGTDKVEIRVIGYRGRPDGAGVLRIQVGSFAEEGNALALKAFLERSYSPVRVVPVELWRGRRFRVMVGQFVSEEHADELAVRLEDELATETLVIRDDT